jgi:hypothetical protein
MTDAVAEAKLSNTTVTVDKGQAADKAESKTPIKTLPWLRVGTFNACFELIEP